MSMQDNEIKAGIFPGKAIIVKIGKIVAIRLFHPFFHSGSHLSPGWNVQVASAFPLPHHSGAGWLDLLCPELLEKVITFILPPRERLPWEEHLFRV
jgi:hypothetical protein